MKKILFCVLATLAVATPALAQFSVSGSFGTTYSTILAPNLTGGVDASVNVPVLPSFGVYGLLSPFVEYKTDLANSDALTVSAFARVRAPLVLNLLPSAGISFGLSPLLGVTANYKVSNELSISGQVRLYTSVSIIPSTIPFFWDIDAYAQADYKMGDIGLYGGLSFGEIVPTFSIPAPYIGANIPLGANLNFNPNLAIYSSGPSLWLHLIYKM